MYSVFAMVGNFQRFNKGLMLLLVYLLGRVKLPDLGIQRTANRHAKRIFDTLVRACPQLYQLYALAFLPGSYIGVVSHTCDSEAMGRF
jgi:hypothetical protein